MNNFNELKYNLESEKSRQLSTKPPLTFISKPLPTTSSLKPLPPIASPPKPLPPISPPNSLPTTSTSKPPLTTLPHKPLLTTSPPKSQRTTSPLKPTPLTLPNKPLSTISPHKPIPASSPPKPLPTTSPPRTPTTISPSKLPTITSPHKLLPTTSASLSSSVKTKLKLNKSNAGFYIFTFLKIPFLLVLSPIFLNYVNNFRYSVFYNNLVFMQFLHYTTFRLDCFHIFCQNLFNFKMGREGFNYMFKILIEYF